jgi:endonuclease YncB( thermonuclease family)
MAWILLAFALAACQPAASNAHHAAGEPSATRAPEIQSLPDSPVQPLSPPPVSPTRRPVAAAVWLQPAAGGDGDSWKDLQGREYRLGLVNTPETNECYGSVATRERKQLVANGFRARVYTHDTYGRSVSVVTLRDGTNLNVYLAQHGYANDRYLAEFRHENPALAAQLDVAFAAAKRERAGLWSACAARAPAPQPLVQNPSSSCHPDYLTCIPIKGDGSGSGAANDLDCPDIGKWVQLRQVGVDPYRLDADGDGFGCDSY